MTVTAKVIVQGYDAETNDDTGEVVRARVRIHPDYADGRNKAWADATPILNLDMTLNGAVAGMFELGKRFTLSFDETLDEPVPVHEQPTENPFREVKTEEEVQEDRQELVDKNEEAKEQWDVSDEDRETADQEAVEAATADTVEDHSRDVPKTSE